MSEYVEELIQNDDLTSQEFPVDEVIILRDKNGKFIGFKARLSNSTESPCSFAQRPQTLKEKCEELSTINIHEIQKNSSRICKRL